MRHIATTMLLSLLVSLAHAVDVQTAIVRYYQQMPQEKIFVHTDKDAYLGGDTLWFRAHLVDALTHRQAAESRFVYVELYDDAMNMKERHMVKADTLGVFANALRLSPTFPTGTYTLVAYTQWMQNFPSKRFFYKHITIMQKDATAIPAPPSDDATAAAPTLHDAVAATAGDISVSQRGDYLFVQAKDATGRDKRDYAIALYGSGNLVVVDSLTDKPCTFRQKELCCGATNIALVNKHTGEVVAERLAFISGAGLPEVSISSTNGNAPHAPVSLSIAVSNMEGEPLSGNFSISVTDASVVERDTLQQDIATYLLAGSEVEPMNSDVVRLFRLNDNSSAARLSNLLASQRDLRFHLDTILSGNKPHVSFNIQKDQRLSGTIRGTIRRKMKNPHILLLNPFTGILENYELEHNTHFNLTDMDFQDGATFILEGARRSGTNNMVELKLDEPCFPQPYVVKSPLRRHLLTDNFLRQERIHASINGLFADNYLEEMDVIGRRREENRRPNTLALHDYNRERDGELLYRDVITWLRTMNIDPRHATIYVDGFIADEEELRHIDISMAKSMTAYTQHFWDFDYKAMNEYHFMPTFRNTLSCVVFIALSVPRPRVKDEPLAIKEVKPLGYMPPVSAKSFCREPSAEGMDHRTTLFWSPYVPLSADGKAQVTFYSSDISRRYRVIIQGIADNGTIINKEIEL